MTAECDAENFERGVTGDARQQRRRLDAVTSAAVMEDDFLRLGRIQRQIVHSRIHWNSYEMTQIVYKSENILHIACIAVLLFTSLSCFRVFLFISALVRDEGQVLIK